MGIFDLPPEAMADAGAGASVGMFGGPIGAAIGGGLGLIGGLLTNQSQSDRQAQAQGFSAQQQQFATEASQQQQLQAEEFNAQQAQAGRDFSQQQQFEAERFNDAEANQQRAWQSAALNNTMAYNAQQADIQRQWQQNMSSTAYQRATQDMKAAGINPMLAYMQGGASTPGGSSASVGVPGGSSASVGATGGPSASIGAGGAPALGGPSPQAPVNALMGAWNSALEGAKISEEVDNLVKSGKKLDSSASLDYASGRERAAAEQKHGADAALTRQATDTEKARTDIAESQSVTAQLEALKAGLELQMHGPVYDTAYKAGVATKMAAAGAANVHDIIQTFNPLSYVGFPSGR